MRDLGETPDRPLRTLQTLAFPVVPALEVAFSGYADVTDGRSWG